MSNQAVEIKILGRTLKVNCPTGQEAALIAAAEDFDQRLQNLSERTKVSNPEQLLMFAGLNICSELHSERREKDNKADDLSNRISQLAETLDKALQNQPKR
ncbi:cell division protein ZapA [Photobacterium swingsii]|uniref:Cell division protein ZapA n=1 Tax=Photobacterium swingsii TaxID=680026 RepID=A0A0J8XU19_9GAMM|nr:cell division protein ZapA [Photobacterium swingsii]KMV28849.1 Z-ring-associated protein [Photobacterium swingsii]PSW21648.1 cell division protein ZapA [Photobacterium swingsii]